MVVELFLIGVALSMDAFAVSMCKGLSMRKLNHKHAFVISLFFGGFQAIMPLIGWFLQLSSSSTSSRWITGSLLHCWPISALR